jgi:hypothetical protein
MTPVGELAPKSDGVSPRSAVALERATGAGASPAAAREDRGNGAGVAVALAAAAIVLLPLLKPAGPLNLAPVDGLMAPAVLAFLLWAGMSRWRLRWPYAVPAALMMAGGALAALFGPVPSASAVALVQDAWLLVWCWALVNLASSPERMRVLLGAWAYAGVVWGVLLFVGLTLGLHWLTGQDASEGSRTALRTGDPSYGASYLFVSLMIIWATGRPRRRPVRIAAYIVLVAGILSTGSNSGMVSLIVGVSAASVIGAYGRRGPALAVAWGAALLLVGVVLASTVNLGDLQRKAHSSNIAFLRDGIGRSSVSVAQRSMLLQESIVLRRDGGALGTGPVSTKPRLEARRAQFVKEAHDDYLASIIERGPLGLLGFLLLLAGVGIRVVSLTTKRLAPGFAAVVVRPHALVGAIAGTAVAMAVYELLHLRHVWAMFALVAALSIWGRR